jgi:putative inorganic carbon (HCO3(-)) transporter
MRFAMDDTLGKWLPVKVWIASGIVCLSVIFESLLPLCVAGLGLLYIIDALVNKRGWKRTPADLAILLLILILPLNLIISPHLPLSISHTLRLLSGIGYYYILSSSLSSTQHFRTILVMTALLCLGVSLLAWVTVDWQIYKPSMGITIPEFVSRMQISERVHPNVIAGNLIILTSALFGAGLFAWKNFTTWEKIIVSTAGLSGILTILQSGSRGAWLAFSLAVGLALVLRRRNLGLLYFILIGGFGFAFGMNSLVEFNQAVSQPTGSTVSLALRLEIWARTLDMLRDSPLTGVGIGAFGAVLDALYPLFKSTPGSILHAHNLFLQIAVDLGLPGLIVWLAILMTTTWTCWKSYRQSHTGSIGAGLSVGLLTAQVALAAHGLFDAVTWGLVRTAPLVWALWGLAIALQSASRDPDPDHAR